MTSKKAARGNNTREVLAECHRVRHCAGRKINRLLKEAIDNARRNGNERHAVQLEESLDKQKAGYTRRLRKLDEIERTVHLLRVGSAIRRAEKRDFKRQPPASLFRQFEHPAGGPASGVRDLYFEVIPRGFGSGKDRNYKKAKKRSSSRTTPWKSGEMGRKIRYIFREDALEEVDGNCLTNMGDDLIEVVECSRHLQAIEQLSRLNAGVYRHLIISLPHELTPAERADLLAKLVQPLRNLRLPFCAALHAPDKDGDERNYHAHVVLSLRPFDRVEPFCWEFSATKQTWLDTPASIKTQRQFVSRTFNRALAAAGHETRWTHQSRATRGQKSPGNNKKGPERSRAERKEQAALKSRLAARRAFLDTSQLARDIGALAEVADGLDRCLAIAADIFSSIAARMGAALAVKLEVLGDMQARAKVVADASKAEPDPTPVEHRHVSISQQLVDAEDAAAKSLDGAVSTHLEAVRKAVLEGRLFARQPATGQYEISAERELLAAWQAFIQTDEGRAYCRAIIDVLPEPADEDVDLPSIRMTRSPIAAAPEPDFLLQMFEYQKARGKDFS